MQVTINLPDTLSATSRKVELSAATASLPIAILELMIPHSFQQLLGDAAASAAKSAFESEHPGVDYDAKVERHKMWVRANPDAVTAQVAPLMQKRLDALLAGEWSVRSTGGTNATVGLATLRLYRATMDKATLKRFNALEAADQLRHATANITDGDAITREVAAIEAEREAARARADERKAQVAELAKDIKFDF